MNAEKSSKPVFDTSISRRNLLTWLARGAVAAVVLALVGRAARKPATSTRLVWQVDPEKCTQCGRCATMCVLETSAVKCVHAHKICGYCRRCFGFFQPDKFAELDESGEKQLCPTGAIKRTFVEDPYFEYTIDETKCIGCALCVKGCSSFGNGSLFLQVRHDRCVNCNECRIAANCPSGAISRVPMDTPYIIKPECVPVSANQSARARI